MVTFSPPPPQAPLTGEQPLPRQLYELYATRYPATANLSLTVTTNATYWGDVLGALTAFKTQYENHVAGLADVIRNDPNLSPIIQLS